MTDIDPKRSAHMRRIRNKEPSGVVAFGLTMDGLLLPPALGERRHRSLAQHRFEQGPARSRAALPAVDQWAGDLQHLPKPSQHL
jgi:hypothetical protein